MNIPYPGFYRVRSFFMISGAGKKLNAGFFPACAEWSTLEVDKEMGVAGTCWKRNPADPVEC
ncbi:hypothetical protein EAJ17_01245 [Akkermansia sp. aa_0143]|nr:hypothetical protein EAJ17_01245 [Akkermansia sp. aa_0143]